MSKQDNYVRHTVRIPSDTYAKVEANAAANNRSINAEIIARLEGSAETLRDKFAMAALASYGAPFNEAATRKHVSHRCYEMADAMLAARSGESA